MAVSDLLARRRPHRADAARNFDALLVAAREAFSEFGTEVSMNVVAQRAGIGIATLYRNFPTREDLIECVYVAEVGALCRYADELGDLEPGDALIAWLRRFVAYMGTKRALIEGLNRESDAFSVCRDALYETGGPMVERAQQARAARAGVDIDDIMRLVIGVTAGVFRDEDQRERVFQMVAASLRPE